MHNIPASQVGKASVVWRTMVEI